MKILMINKYHHIVGGADRYYFLLSRILTQHGHEVIPFSTQHPENLPSAYAEYFVGNSLTHQNYRAAAAAARARAFVDGIYNWHARKKIEALIEVTKPDIAHLHNFFYQLSPSILEPLRRKNIPVVQTLHDHQPACASHKFLANGKICEACKDSLFSILRQRCYNGDMAASVLAFTAKVTHRLLKLYEERIDQFITPSQYLRNKLIDHRLPPKKMTYIPHPIDEPAPMPEVPSKFDNTILFIGRLSRHKGIYTLFEAMAPLRSFRLQIAGTGDALGDLQRMISERQLQHVELLHFLHKEALALTLAKASLVVVPSECYDNAPLVVYEAFVAGKPVLGARIGGIPELITPELGELFESGNVLDLRQKIEKMMAQPAQLQQMGARARLHARERFSAEKHYEQIMNLYRQFMVGKQ
jgi:glycosyltransferase involved in cell wall biosynthesis